MLNVRDLAQLSGVRQAELLALSPANDPFALHQPARRLGAQWFAAIWEKLELGNGIHIRRIHYRLVSIAPPETLPGGDPYLNTERCWKFLVNASRDARYLRLVPGGAFVDRRNPDPVTHFAAHQDGGVNVSGGGIYDEFEADFPSLPQIYFGGAQYGPPALVELWAEKTSMNDVLVPLARHFGANLITGAGEMSLTSVGSFLDRVRKADAPARILYISDFDPAGRSMPVAVARKIEFALDGANDLDIRLNPVVLTRDQCAQYALPRTPIKESERRGALFESRFGAGATELDALEALHPGELARIVASEISRYIDPDGRWTFNAAVDEYSAYLKEISDTAQAPFEAQLERLREAREDIVKRHTAWQERAEPIFEEIETALWRLSSNIGPFAPPPPKEPDDPDHQLFDSRRDYLTQMDSYRRWQEGAEGADE